MKNIPVIQIMPNTSKLILITRFQKFILNYHVNNFLPNNKQDEN